MILEEEYLLVPMGRLVASDGCLAHASTEHAGIYTCIHSSEKSVGIMGSAAKAAALQQDGSAVGMYDESELSQCSSDSA